MHLSERAASILAETGIRPWQARDYEIELAERLAKEYRYIDSAADEMRKILAAPPRS
jgi:hypothetical protein